MVFDTCFFYSSISRVTHVDGLPLPIDKGYFTLRWHSKIHQSLPSSCFSDEAFGGNPSRTTVLRVINQSPFCPQSQQMVGFFTINRLNPNKNLKVKKRILEELEVPREVRTLPFLCVKFGSFLPTSWPFAPNKTWVKPEGVFPLYRDRFTGEMMMFLRRRCFFLGGNWKMEVGAVVVWYFSSWEVVDDGGILRFCR